MAVIPNSVPSSFVAGDTVTWNNLFSGYSTADGWSHSHAFVKNGFKFAESAVVALDTGGSQSTINAVDSLVIEPGEYKYQAYASRGSERFMVEAGTTEVKPNFATQAGGYDARSDVEKMLDALNACLVGKASQDQQSLSLNGRSLSRMTVEELTSWRNNLKEEVRNERGEGRKPIRTRL